MAMLQSNLVFSQQKPGYSQQKPGYSQQKYVTKKRAAVVDESGYFASSTNCRAKRAQRFHQHVQRTVVGSNRSK
jgi:hypothetical protein